MGLYDVKTHSYEPENFYAGAQFPRMTGSKAPSAVIAKYEPVAIDADGKLASLTAATDTGLYGIALEEADEKAVQDGRAVPVLLTGEVFASALTLPASVAAADLEVPFRKLGIFLK